VEVKLSLRAIEEMYTLFTGKKITTERYIHLIYHLFNVAEEKRYETPV
jgi:hypothetical protein